MIQRALTILAAGFVALHVSGCGGDSQRVLLADFDFARSRETVFHSRFGQSAGLHWFADGFTARENEGIWTVGAEATVFLYTLGKNVVLDLDLGTRPFLARDGQHVAVRWNGHELGEYPVARGWDAQTVTVIVPDEAVRAGLNEVVLSPRLHPGGQDLPAGTEDLRPLGIFLRGLRVDAALNGGQQRRWADLLQGPGPDPDLEVVEVPPDLVGPTVVPSEQPDVLVVMLDAARADHFGCYGYHRETSPHIDRLAADAVRLDNVLAVAPFTLISVSSLFSARSWRDHGVVRKGQALSESFWTVPELFRRAGYLTLGFSDNPYVGKATRLAQGFVEFQEAWNHPLHAQKRHLLHEGAAWHVPHRLPEMVEWLFANRLGEGLGEGPVFAYLHIMPPHGPYVPGPDHDLFGDPRYAGDIDGSAAQIADLENHRRSPSADDVRRLESLYDGNLHRADASVGRILEAWHRQRRERELLVVVVADHGEAFGEHGRFAHLSTVYDEMLQVPVILWPREEWREVEPLQDELLSLTDLSALLLRRAGVGLPEGSRWPRRFIALMTGDVTSGRRQVVARSFVDAGLFGLRTARYLAVYGGAGIQELYDLESDPAAQRNLRGDRPELYTELITSLRNTLREADAVEVGEARMSDEAVQALKAVGYF